MKSAFELPVPKGYDLARDVCSYGYFLLAPNAWDPATKALWRPLCLHDARRKHAGKPVLVRVSQARRGSVLRVDTTRTLTKHERSAAIAQLTRMLRLDDGPSTVREFHALDPRWKRSGRCRLFRSPTLFEDVVKTVTSCNVTWPGTVVMNRRLCEAVGREVLFHPIASKPRAPTKARSEKESRARPVFEPVAFAFPTPAQLAAQRPARLRALCRLGYRDARIVALAKLFATPASRGGVDQAMLENPSEPDGAVFEALLKLPGIGPYAAANIMQLLGRYGRLPLDTESVRHGTTVLGYKGTNAQIMRTMEAHYAPLGVHAFRSYWFELWEFYEHKHGKAWTWERETTGRMFTAALLNKTL